MKVPLFILGMLAREGPLHGYRLTQLIAERAADFAHIKLPTLYYHLEKLLHDGLVEVHAEREGKRPERAVYRITEHGRQELLERLDRVLDESFSTDFPIDAALFFSDSIKPERLHAALEERARLVEEALTNLEQHRRAFRAETKVGMPPAAEAIFQHHQVHLRAERDWALAAADTLRGARTSTKGKKGERR